MNNAGVSVVIPVYRSELTLGPLLERLAPVLAGLGQPFEVVLVNDASPDGSWRVIEGLVARYPWLSAIELMRNYGQHNAILCGVRAARYGTVVTMDDDLQHPPEEVPRLLAKLDEGVDVVYGVPERQRHGVFRDVASLFTKWALRAAMSVDVAAHVSAFRVFRTSLREAFAEVRGPFVNLDVLLSWGTSRFAAECVSHAPRAAGTSNYTIGKLLVHAATMVTTFSAAPLRMASYAGFLLALVGAGLLVRVLVIYVLAGSPVPGFPFLACTITVFAGGQLFALGIMGEYLARMHFRLLDKPPYMARRVLRQECTQRSAAP